MNKTPDNQSDIKNPNNDAYWKSRGYEKRPTNWKQLIQKGGNHESKRQRLQTHGGRGCVDSMFDPLSKDDY